MRSGRFEFQQWVKSVGWKRSFAVDEIKPRVAITNSLRSPHTEKCVFILKPARCLKNCDHGKNRVQRYPRSSHTQHRPGTRAPFARPGEGPTGAFAFGRARGVIEGVLAAAGFPVTFVSPPDVEAHVARVMGQCRA
jgi:hypothetical protein